MNNLFTYNDYKQYLRKKVTEAHGTLTELAQAAGCQRSYFSRVLSSKIHLTPEHALNLAEHWHLQESEKNYFLILVDYGREGTPALRKHLLQKLSVLRQEYESLDRLVHRPKVDVNENVHIYYSAWYWSAIHIGTSIPELQSVNALANKFSLPLPLVEYCLSKLAEMGYVKQTGKKWHYVSSEIHIAAGSPYVVNHHNNYRNRALLSAQVANPENLHFTVVQSVSKAAFQKIRQEMLGFIQTASSIAGPSKEEELIAVNCDFFKM